MLCSVTSMAGTVQALILSPSYTTKPESFPFMNRHLPPTRTLLFSRSVSSNRNRSISTTIKASERPNQIGDGHGSKRTPSKDFYWGERLLNFAGNNFLPLALISGVAMGFANPSLGCLADRYYLSKFSTFGIFIISGLTLRNGDIGAAMEAWPVGIFGLCSILFFTPFFSKIILQIRLQPQEFVTGLALFSCMPTTLSSGVALTNLAGGNSALALAMTVISNLLGIMIVPFSISKFIAYGVGVSLPSERLFRSLVLTLLIPLIVGKVFRESFKGLGNFVDQNRKLFSKVNSALLGLVPWIQVSRSRSLLLLVKPEGFLVAVLLGMFLHLMLLSFNILANQSLSAVSGGSQSVFAKKENSTALILVASQKTLPVLVAVVEQLGGAFGESGLLVLPCVAAHLNQIIMDSFIANFWLQKGLASNKAKVQVVSESGDGISFKRI